MVLTSIKNYSKVQQFSKDMGVNFKTRNGTIRIQSEMYSDEAISNGLKITHGVNNIIENSGVAV